MSIGIGYMMYNSLYFHFSDMARYAGQVTQVFCHLPNRHQILHAPGDFDVQEGNQSK